MNHMYFFSWHQSRSIIRRLLAGQDAQPFLEDGWARESLRASCAPAADGLARFFGVHAACAHTFERMKVNTRPYIIINILLY